MSNSMREFVSKEKDLEEVCSDALDLIFCASQVDGAHHKAWVLDQITRKLTRENYENFVNTYCFDGINDVNDPEEVKAWKKVGGRRLLSR